MSPATLEVLRLSLKVGLCCAGLSLVPAILCGWLLARREFAGKALLDVCINLPLVLPPISTGYLLLVLFGLNGPLGDPLYRYLGIRLAFTWQGAVLASMVVSFPLFVRSARIAFEMIDHRLEQLSWCLGQPPLRTFWRISLPLALPGILSGLLLSLARSLGEFGATVTFAGSIAGETRTLPLAIYNLMQVPGQERAAFGLVLISIACATAAFGFSEALLRYHQRFQEGGHAHRP